MECEHKETVGRGYITIHYILCKCGKNIWLGEPPSEFIRLEDVKELLDQAELVISGYQQRNKYRQRVLKFKEIFDDFKQRINR